MTQNTASWRRDLWLLVAMNAFGHVQYIAARFTMLLYAVQLQSSPATMGSLLAVSSLLPTLTSVQLGKMLDKRTDLRAPMLWALLLLSVSILIPFFWSSIAALFLMCVINGANFTLYRIATQQLIGKLGGPADRASNYTIYSMAMAMANVVSPLIAGFSIDHIGVAPAFLICAAVGLPPLVVLAMRIMNLANPRGPGEEAQQHHGSSWDLLRDAALRRVLFAGAVLMTAWDVFSFMVPVYGSQLQFSASQIGMCASAFYAGSFSIRIWSRLMFSRFTHWQILILSMAVSGGLLILYPLVSGFVLLFVLSFIIGNAIGMTQPMMMALSYEQAPANRKAEVIGLRLTMTHGLQIVIPLLAGALGTAFGLTVAYWFGAGTLLLGCWIARREWSRPRPASH